jgi:AAHS family 4-hydroxybenzoate transporter-like MFS transporter
MSHHGKTHVARENSHGWLPTMLSAQNLDLATASFGLAVYNLGGVFGVLVWTVLVTMLGSRGPLLSGALACAGSAGAIRCPDSGSG